MLAVPDRPISDDPDDLVDAVHVILRSGLLEQWLAIAAMSLAGEAALA